MGADLTGVLPAAESPTNPYLRCVDVPKIAELCRAHGALVCIDSTFATPINQKAISLGGRHRHPFRHQVPGRPQRCHGRCGLSCCSSLHSAQRRLVRSHHASMPRWCLGNSMMAAWSGLPVTVLSGNDTCIAAGVVVEAAIVAALRVLAWTPGQGVKGLGQCVQGLWLARRSRWQQCGPCTTCWAARSTRMQPT